MYAHKFELNPDRDYAPTWIIIALGDEKTGIKGEDVVTQFGETTWYHIIPSEYEQTVANVGANDAFIEVPFIDFTRDLVELAR